MSSDRFIRAFLLSVVAAASWACDTTSKDPREVSGIQLHAGPVNAVVFTPDGNTLVSASDDHLIRLLNSEGLKNIEGSGSVDEQVLFERDVSPLSSPGHGFDCLAVSPDGTELSACDFDASNGGVVRQYDISDRDTVSVKMLGTGSLFPLRSIAYGPDGTLLAAAQGAPDWWGETQLFLTDNGTEVAAFHEIFGGLSDVSFSPDGTEVMSVSWFDEIRVFDRDGEEIRSFGMDSHHPIAAAYVPGTDWIVSTGEEDATLTNTHRGQLQVWQGDGERMRTVRLSKQAMRAVAVAPNGTVAAVAGDDMVVRIVDLESFSIVAEIKGHTAAVNDVAFTPNSRFLASCGADNYVFVWNVTDLTGPKESDTDSGDTEYLRRRPLRLQVLALQRGVSAL